MKIYFFTINHSWKALGTGSCVGVVDVHMLHCSESVFSIRILTSSPAPLVRLLKINISTGDSP